MAAFATSHTWIEKQLVDASRYVDLTRSCQLAGHIKGIGVPSPRTLGVQPLVPDPCFYTILSIALTLGMRRQRRRKIENLYYNHEL